MQNVLIIVHAAPYGSERSLSALRVALALSDGKAKVSLFLMSDATVTALDGQVHASGNTLQNMVETLLGQGGSVKLCRTCLQNRGLLDARFIAGCQVGTLDELADAIVAADKVLTF